ncbi:TonB family protein [Fibrobacterota bacterium]
MNDHALEELGPLDGSTPGPDYSAFPQDLEYHPWKDLNKRFLTIYTVVFLLVGSAVFSLSFIEPNLELTAREALQIKQRYARLELDKPKKEKPQKLVEPKKPGAGSSAKKTGPKIDRSKESKTQKQARKKAGTHNRAKVRESLKQSIEQAGLFAELTAMGEEGEGEIDDLLARGTAADLGSIDLNNIGFTARPTANKASKNRKGARVTSMGIGKQKIEKAEMKKIQVEAEVKMAAPKQIVGSASAESSRNASSIRSVILKIQNKIKLQFEKYLRQDPSLAGKVEIEFVIRADGSVMEARIAFSSLDHPPFERRLLNMINRLKFAPASSDVIITWPFIFATSET